MIEDIAVVILLVLLSISLYIVMSNVKEKNNLELDLIEEKYNKLEELKETLLEEGPDGRSKVINLYLMRGFNQSFYYTNLTVDENVYVIVRGKKISLGVE